ncbi:hypothetical protein [Pseudoalteromonas byunsanensis]|uniref:KTSC domain-containing protein n=1 Tax=Pseudoalteromonas byunsanensis TaxID=327939 RepID=A0A1S1NDH7_9GAMM|nr:hypothetical protein [Pseudoalteromonas byunsanensis]OHU97889.1 hypothetical protein BIW53_00505 [Pseudoalteromonas byunsanensis]
MKNIVIASLVIGMLSGSVFAASEKTNEVVVGSFGEITTGSGYTTAEMSIPEYKKYFRYIGSTDEVANITSKCRILTYVYHDSDFNNIKPVDYRIQAYSKTKLYRDYQGLRNRFASAQRLC